MGKKENIILTGFMGTGKTTAGKLIAKELGYEFIDTDELIMSRYGKSISRIFREDGEEFFRQVESSLAKELANREGCVISTGGRMMLDPENASALEQSGRVFCLVATPEEILARVSSDASVERPLLKAPNPLERVVELLQQRKEGYGRFAQFVTSEKSVGEVAKMLSGIVQSDLDLRQSISVQQTQYEFMVGGGILPYVTQLGGIVGPVAILTDKTVGALYAHLCGPLDRMIEIPSDQQHKTLETVQYISEELIERGFDRSGTIIALGGSVISELAGFVAAIYMRGVNLVQCPTSLLAMIDTSIGGKAAVNLTQGNNILGVYKQPKAVIADVATLQTLPVREFRSGMAEVIKHALISGNTGLLNKLEGGSWKLEAGELLPSLADLQDLVARAIQIKIGIIQEDPFEKGRRLVLNFGHTFGHAIEHASGYSIPHGEAVAMGITAATTLSVQLGYCSPTTKVRIQTMLANNGLPTRIPQSVRTEEILRALKRDKKQRQGNLKFILIREIGDVFITDTVAEETVIATLEGLQA